MSPHIHHSRGGHAGKRALLTLATLAAVAVWLPLRLLSHSAVLDDVAGAAQAWASVAAVQGSGHTAAGAAAGSERPTARMLQDSTPLDVVSGADGQQEKPKQQRQRGKQGGRRLGSSRGQQARAQVQPVQPAPARPGLRSTWAIAEEDASWEVEPRYSTHTCIGPKPEDRWQAATCKFDNVCLNASTLEFEYYLDTELYPDMPVAHDQLSAQPLDQFSEHLVSAVMWMQDKNKTAGWRPIVKRQPFPQMGERVRWASVPQALLQAYPQRLLVNFGHVMFDLAVPLFTAQHLFGVYRPDAQVLVLNTTLSDRWDEVDYYMQRMINTPDPARSLFRLSWDSDALWLRNYTRTAFGDDGDGLVCFKTVLAGMGNLTRRGRASDALPYRAAVAERLGLQEVAVGHEERPVITLLDKEGRRIIENYREVHAMLRQRYPGARVQLMDFGKHPDLTMAEQVELMSDTNILISPCGGLATVLAFMRPGSTAIVMNFWNTHLNRSIMMEEAFYNNLEYLDLQYFPVNLDDYEGTTDRPECELVANGTRRHDSRYPQSGALVNCNLHFAPTALTRMAHTVDQAMMRWAAKRGRWDVLEPLQELRAAELAAGAGSARARDQAQGSKQAQLRSGSAAAGQLRREQELRAEEQRRQARLGNVLSQGGDGGDGGWQADE